VALVCESVKQLSVQIENVLKFSRFGGTDAVPRFRLYYRKSGDDSPNSLFEADTCQQPTDWSLRFLDHSTADGSANSSPRDVPFNDLIDYVGRMRVEDQHAVHSSLRLCS
jgi:hypothetical protein